MEGKKCIQNVGEETSSLDKCPFERPLQKRNENLRSSCMWRHLTTQKTSTWIFTTVKTSSFAREENI